MAISEAKYKDFLSNMENLQFESRANGGTQNMQQPMNPLAVAEKKEFINMGSLGVLVLIGVILTGVCLGMLVKTAKSLAEISTRFKEVETLSEKTILIEGKITQILEKLND